MINELGRLHHPNRPYSDPRVSIHLDDGRGFVRKTAVALRPDQLRGRRFAGLAFQLFERPPRELPVHRAGVSRHQGQAQARRRVRDVQLLPPGLGRGPAGEAGRDRLRLAADRRLAAVSRCHLLRTTTSATTSRFSWSATARRRSSNRSGRSSRPTGFFWLNPEPRFNAGGERLRPGASGRRRAPRAGVHEDRPGRGRAGGHRHGSRPTTGRSSTFASRRSPPSTCAAWRSWRCSRW